MLLCSCSSLSVGLPAKLRVPHHFAVVVLSLYLLEPVIGYLPRPPCSLVLAVPPLFLTMIEWSIHIILLVLILLSSIINHNWPIWLVVFTYTSVDGRFTNLVVV